MSQTVQTPFGTGTVVDREDIRGRVSYKVEGPGFSTWIEATAMPLDFQWMPGPDDIQPNSVTLPYNPRPQTWQNPQDQNIVPGRQTIDPRKRTAPADSVDFQEDGERYEPGPDPKLFAGSLSPEDIQAKLGPKYVNAFNTYDPHSFQSRLEEHPEIVFSELQERVAELADQADQEYLSRIGQNEYLEAADPQLREAAWKDVRAKAVRLRRSGQINLRGATPDVIATQVTGDHGTYEVMVMRSNIFQGNSAVDSWTCECPWGQWAWKREHSFVGRMCSHAYASLMELQALTQSKTPNPKFRNHPAVWASRTAEVVDIGSKIFHRDYADIYGTVVEDDGDAYLVDGPGGEYWIDHEDARLASRTAAGGDMDLAMFFSRYENEGLDVSLSPDAQWSWIQNNVDYDILKDDVNEAYENGELGATAAEELLYDLEGRWGARQAEIVDLRPVGWDPYSRNLMNRLRDLWEEGSRPGKQKERNEEIRELVDELRERGFATDGVIASLKDGFIDSPMGYGDIPDYGTSDEYVLEHELQHREDVTEPEFVYPAGGGHGVVNDINDGGRNQVAALSLPKGTQVQRLNLDGSPSGQTGVVSRDHQGLTEWDQVAVLWDGDDKPSLNDLTEVQWGEYEDGTPTKKLDDPWNVHGANDGYVYGEPPAYDSGDEYGGDENPYYVDPAEQTDWEDPLPESEDNIVANFQRNAGWLMGGNEGGSGGDGDIAAAAEAHLRTAGRHFTMAEQQALIDEDDGLPYDPSNLRLDGTHYL